MNVSRTEESVNLAIDLFKEVVDNEKKFDITDLDNCAFEPTTATKVGGAGLTDVWKKIKNFVCNKSNKVKPNVLPLPQQNQYRNTYQYSSIQQNYPYQQQMSSQYIPYSQQYQNLYSQPNLQHYQYQQPNTIQTKVKNVKNNAKASMKQDLRLPPIVTTYNVGKHQISQSELTNLLNKERDFVKQIKEKQKEQNVNANKNFNDKVLMTDDLLRNILSSVKNTSHNDKEYFSVVYNFATACKNFKDLTDKTFTDYGLNSFKQNIESFVNFMHDEAFFSNPNSVLTLYFSVIDKITLKSYLIPLTIQSSVPYQNMILAWWGFFNREKFNKSYEMFKNTNVKEKDYPSLNASDLGLLSNNNTTIDYTNSDYRNQDIIVTIGNNNPMLFQEHQFVEFKNNDNIKKAFENLKHYYYYLQELKTKEVVGIKGENRFNDDFYYKYRNDQGKNVAEYICTYIQDLQSNKNKLVYFITMSIDEQFNFTERRGTFGYTNDYFNKAVLEALQSISEEHKQLVAQYILIKEQFDNLYKNDIYLTEDKTQSYLPKITQLQSAVAKAIFDNKDAIMYVLSTKQSGGGTTKPKAPVIKSTAKYTKTSSKYTNKKGDTYIVYSKGEKQYIRKLSKTTRKYVYRQI